MDNATMDLEIPARPVASIAQPTEESSNVATSSNCTVDDAVMSLEHYVEPANFNDLPMEVSSNASAVPVTYSLVGDNLDTNVKCRYKRTDGCSNQSLHYFHSIAVKDRIDKFSQLDITPYHGCLNNITQTALNLLPTLKSDADFLNLPAQMLSPGIVNTSIMKK